MPPCACFPCSNHCGYSNYFALRCQKTNPNELTRPRSLVVQLSTGRASQPAMPADTDGVRSLGDSQTCGAPSQSSEPNSANRERFLLEPITGNEKDDDPETTAIFCNSLDFTTTPPMLLSLLCRPRRGVPAAVRSASALHQRSFSACYFAATLSLLHRHVFLQSVMRSLHGKKKQPPDSNA